MGEVSCLASRHGTPWPEYAYGPALLPAPAPGPGSMWRYRALLPLGDGPVRYAPPVGGTPLLSVPRLRAAYGIPGLWVKDETTGLTASNKDRATALVIEDGLRRGIRTITTASTGNAAVATAFGAAAAGLRAVIFVSSGCRPDKLRLMLHAGADVFQVRDGYAAATGLSRAAAAHFGWLDRNTGVNPLTIEAKKTVALEVWEQMGRRAPDVVVIPVGDGPTLCGIYKGFAELVRCGAIARLPRLIGVQSACCQPLRAAWAGREPRQEELNPAATMADGIAVPVPATPGLVLEGIRASDGFMLAVDEQEIEDARAALSSLAGITAEPTGAVALAGLRQAAAAGFVRAADDVVVLLTGREKTVPPPGRHRAGCLAEGSLDEVAACLGLPSGLARVRTPPSGGAS